MAVRWRAERGPIVRADWIFFIKFILFYYQEYGNWKITSSIGSYRNNIPNPTLDAWIQRGLGGPHPTPPPHPPKKSHVLWVSIEISIPRHPKINKNTVTPHLVRRNATRYNYFLEFQMFTGETLMRLSVCTYKTQSVTGKWAITYF